MLLSCEAIWTNRELAESLLCWVSVLQVGQCFWRTAQAGWNWSWHKAPLPQPGLATVCDIFPRAQAYIWSWYTVYTYARYFMVFHSELCCWFHNIHGSNSSGNIEQYCNPLEGCKPSAVACPPFIDQSAPMLLAALLRAVLGKHKCLLQYLLTQLPNHLSVVCKHLGSCDLFGLSMH